VQKPITFDDVDGYDGHQWMAEQKVMHPNAQKPDTFNDFYGFKSYDGL